MLTEVHNHWVLYAFTIRHDEQCESMDRLISTPGELCALIISRLSIQRTEAHIYSAEVVLSYHEVNIDVLQSAADGYDMCAN